MSAFKVLVNTLDISHGHKFTGWLGTASLRTASLQRCKKPAGSPPFNNTSVIIQKIYKKINKNQK